MPYDPTAPAGKRLRGLQLDLYVNPAAEGERLSEGHYCVFLVDVVNQHRDAGRARYMRRPEAACRALTADTVHDLDQGDGHGDLAVALVHRDAHLFGQMPPILVPWRLVEGEPHLADRVAASDAVVAVPAEVGPPFASQTWRMHDHPLLGTPTWKPITDA